VNATASLSSRVTDNGTSTEELIVTANSSNTSLVSNTNVVVGHDQNSGDWILTVTPASNQTGTTTITLTATNDVAMGTTTNFLLTVVEPQLLDGELFNDDLTWTTWGNAPWFAQSSISHDGDSAAQSGVIGDDGESWLETTVVGPGNLTFWWRVSSEHHWDWLEFYINGEPQTNRISGEVDWHQQTVRIPPGNQILSWLYLKDPCCTHGLDAAWLDEVTFVPRIWIDLIDTPANGQCQLILHVVPGKSYEVQATTNLANWYTVTAVVATDMAMPFLDVDADAGGRFYRLRELPPNPTLLENVGSPNRRLKTGTQPNGSARQ
jgi:hypothetical protein